MATDDIRFVVLNPRGDVAEKVAHRISEVGDGGYTAPCDRFAHAQEAQLVPADRLPAVYQSCPRCDAAAVA